MINVISNKAATYIKSKVPEHPASIAVIQYGMAVVLNTVSIIIFSLLVSIWTGRFVETVIAMIGFATLRQVSGGVHLKSGELCIFVSVTVISLLSFAEFGTITIVLMNMIAFILVLIFAPSRIDKQTRIPKQYFKYLRLIALAIITISIFINHSVLAASLLAQSLTLIRKRR